MKEKIVKIIAKNILFLCGILMRYLELIDLVTPDKAIKDLFKNDGILFTNLFLSLFIGK